MYPAPSILELQTSSHPSLVGRSPFPPVVIPGGVPDQSLLNSAMFPQHFLNRQGLLLFVRRWPVPNPRGIVFLIHGLAEHIGRYDALALLLNRAGYWVVGLDNQGHGQSDGDRAYTDKFDSFAQDIADFVNTEETIYEQHSGSPLPAFLLGHSLGGLIAVRTILQHKPTRWPWNGVILSAAALTIDPKLANPIMKALGTILAYILPKAPATKLDCEDISSIRSVVDDYKRDPLTTKGFVRCLFGIEILRAAENSLKRASEFSEPILIMHGALDKVTGSDGSLSFSKSVGSQDVTYLEYKNSMHEIFNDVERKEVYSALLEWILTRSMSNTATSEDSLKSSKMNDYEEKSGTEFLDEVAQGQFKVK